MEPFKLVKSNITHLDKVNVDTDQIVPKQFLKFVQKSGFGKFYFTTGDMIQMKILSLILS